MLLFLETARASFRWVLFQWGFGHDLYLRHFDAALVMFFIFENILTYSDANLMMDYFMIIGSSVYALKGFSSCRITEMVPFLSSVCVCACVRACYPYYVDQVHRNSVFQMPALWLLRTVLTHITSFRHPTWRRFVSSRSTAAKAPFSGGGELPARHCKALKGIAGHCKAHKVGPFIEILVT